MGHRSLAIFFLVLFTINNSHSSSCCGGGNNAPLVMTKEAISLITILTKHSAITHYADENAKLTVGKNNYSSVTNNTDISGILSINQRTQISGLITYTKRINSTVLKKEISHGLNKLLFQLNYEFLPEYLYSSWRPRGFFFVNISHPLSKSIFESKKIYQTDAISNPQTSYSIGMLFKKNLNYFDILTSASISLHFPKNIKWNNKNLNAGDFFKLNYLVDFGYSPQESDFRFGLSLNYIYNSENMLSKYDKMPDSYLLSLGINFSYEHNDLIFGLNYADQSYLSFAKNNSLTKTVGLNLSKTFY